MPRSADPNLSMEISRAPGATLPTISGRSIYLATERHVSFVFSFNHADTRWYHTHKGPVDPICEDFIRVVLPMAAPNQSTN